MQLFVDNLSRNRKIIILLLCQLKWRMCKMSVSSPADSSR